MYIFVTHVQHASYGCVCTLYMYEGVAHMHRGAELHLMLSLFLLEDSKLLLTQFV